MPAIETKDLRKSYGRIEALRGVSLSVERGEIYGLLGQNGAGKTTLIKILLGIARKWQGQANLLDKPAGTVSVLEKVGYLPEDHRFPGYHSAYSLLHFYGQLLGVPRTQRRKMIPEMLELVGLKGREHNKIRTYSKGMKQRVGIAQALFHDPDMIFLDEPTDGVDPLGRRTIRGMLHRLKDRGKTIFLNSHLLGEIELICDRVAILRKGVLVREGDIESLTRHRNLFAVGIADNQVFPEEECRQLGVQVSQNGKTWDIVLTDEQSIDSVIDLLRAKNISIRHLVEKRESLEDLFFRTVEDSSTENVTHQSAKKSQQIQS